MTRLTLKYFAKRKKETVRLNINEIKEHIYRESGDKSYVTTADLIHQSSVHHVRTSHVKSVTKQNTHL